MAEVIVPLTEGKYNWLSTLSGDLAIILGRYWEKPFKLKSEEKELVEEFEHYLELVRKGSLYKSNWRSNLSFDRKTLEALRAADYVALVANNKEDIDGFIEKLLGLLENVKQKKTVRKDIIRYYKKQLMRLSELASEESHHPESSHTL